MSWDADWVVVGSGFGGSVAALRLAEKGYSVRVVEKGRRFADHDFAETAWQLGRMLWAPVVGLRGIMAVTPLRHVTVLSGVGVGGGSLVYGNTLYTPHSDDFYRHPQWDGLADWRSVLAPHFETARRMLGVTTFVGDGPSENLLAAISDDLGCSDRVHTTDVGVYFGTPGRTDDDPEVDLRTDIAITTSVHPDDTVHFTNNTYGLGGDAMGLTFGPLTGGRARIRQFVGEVLRHPSRWVLPSRLSGWSRRSVIFTIMQSTDTELRLRRGRFGLPTTEVGDGTAPDGDLPIARRISESAVRHLGGHASTAVTESLLARPTTAHVLGGAVIGADPGHGVVDRERHVFGYRNLLVTDGATLPANPGVNPSLTITAMAEEAMSHIAPHAAGR